LSDMWRHICSSLFVAATICQTLRKVLALAKLGINQTVYTNALHKPLTDRRPTNFTTYQYTRTIQVFRCTWPC